MIINEDFFDEIEIQDAPEQKQHNEVIYDFDLCIDPKNEHPNIKYLKHCLNNIPNTKFDLDNLVSNNNYITVQFDSDMKTFKNLYAFFLSIFNGVGGYYVITVYDKHKQFEADAEMDYILDVMSNPIDFTQKELIQINSGNIDNVADVASLLLKRTVRGREISVTLNISQKKHYRNLFIWMVQLFKHYDEEPIWNGNKMRFYSSFENILKVIQSEQNIKLVMFVDSLHNSSREKLKVFDFKNNGIDENIPYYDIF